jgi:hypothetical protein
VIDIVTGTLGQLLVAALFVALVTAVIVRWNMALARRRLGAFAVEPRPAGQLAFRSDFGRFEFDRAGGTLRVAGSAGERTVALADVANVRLRQDEVDASWPEEFLHGFDLTDMMGFRDQVRWICVVLRLHTGEDIPVYAVGQLRRVEIFNAASIQWLWDRLRKRGWIPDIDEEARAVLAQVATQARQMREAERATA